MCRREALFCLWITHTYILKCYSFVKILILYMSVLNRFKLCCFFSHQPNVFILNQSKIILGRWQRKHLHDLVFTTITDILTLKKNNHILVFILLFKPILFIVCKIKEIKYQKLYMKPIFIRPLIMKPCKCFEF